MSKHETMERLFLELADVCDGVPLRESLYRREIQAAISALNNADSELAKHKLEECLKSQLRGWERPGFGT